MTQEYDFLIEYDLLEKYNIFFGFNHESFYKVATWQILIDPKELLKSDGYKGSQKYFRINKWKKLLDIYGDAFFIRLSKLKEYFEQLGSDYLDAFNLLDKNYLWYRSVADKNNNIFVATINIYSTYFCRDCMLKLKLSNEYIKHIILWQNYELS